MITNLPRGTRDYIGKDMATKSEIERIARELARTFNATEITTPMFEHTDLFLRGVGETTDIVQKEMYTFKDKGDRSITLKPEGTAGVVRAYLENKLFNEPKPMKFFYFTPAFRYEKPQAGRLRQHHQFGFEMFGVDGPLGEVEVISVLKRLFERLGIKGTTLHINSIGDVESRKKYNSELVSYFEDSKGELCETCLARLDKNPMRILDCKNHSCKNVVKAAPITLDHLVDEDMEHFEQLKKYLDALDIDYVVDTSVVRGLDYYTKTVFEFIDEDGLTICGGGRYDRLIKEIDGKADISALGFGIGIERIMLALANENIDLVGNLAPDIYIGFIGDEAKIASYDLVRRLRDAGIKVEYNLNEKNIKPQMKYANKIGARYLALIGQNELETGVLSVKNMESGEKEDVKIDDLIEYMEK